MIQTPARRIVVGVTGASGSIYGKRLLDGLRAAAAQTPLTVGLVYSKNARDVWRLELGEDVPTDFPVYASDDFMAPFASGSARYMDMIVAPCSMGTLGRIAHGFSDDLITRAADVILKERRRLILIPREAPYGEVHLENMLRLTRMGAIILPASPSFYSRPQSFDALADTIIHRALDMIDLPQAAYRWGAGAP